MAKKKASAKKSNVKKVIKKAVKKTVKKAAAKKSPAKSVKKAPAKAKKAVAKKSITKSKVSAKAPAKKTAAKPSTAKAPAFSAAIVSTKKTEKLMDLSNFVTPLDDRLIIQTAGQERMTAGGLYIPDTVGDVSGNLQGHVVAVGRGHRSKKGHLTPMDVKLGDKVVFAAFSGTKINIQDQELIILREVDLLGVVSK